MKEEHDKDNTHEDEDSAENPKEDDEHHNVRSGIESKFVSDLEQFAANDTEQQTALSEDAANGKAEDDRKEEGEM